MLATKFRSAAILRGYSMILAEKDPKIPKHEKVLKDIEDDKEKHFVKQTNKHTVN